MHKEHVNSLVSLSLALLVAIVSVPLTTEALFRSSDDDGTQFEANVPDIFELARSYHEQGQANRREFYEAMEIYREKLKNGELALIKPDINNKATVDYYFGRITLEEAKHAAAPKKVVSSGSGSTTAGLTEETISKDDRALLRRYERAGYCPESLRNYITGFYELCKTLAGKNLRSSPRMGIMNDLIRIQSARNVLPNTLKNRLDMLRQAREGTKRPNTVRPTFRRAAAPPEQQ